jgi:hypothetical protein
MLIEENALKYWIDNFYGYGSWHARFWFISYEEGGGELPEEVADKLNYFYRLRAEIQPASVAGASGPSLCDIRDLYRHVAVRWDGPKANSFANLFEYRFNSKAVLHGVWKNLIAFVHGYRHEKLPDLLAYQRQTFLSGNEALMQLYPLPSPHNHAWYYSWLDFPQLPFLRSRALYEEHVYEPRIHRILSNIRACKPDVVLMYGMNNINTLKRSIEDFFQGVEFKMIKASTTPMASGTIGTKIPQHHRVELNGTTMLITTQIPALRHNRIETGFDWEEFGKTLGMSNVE